MDLSALRKEFNNRYGESRNDLCLYFAPGRVNLIGEHTDYNGGFVFPCALQYGTYLAIRINDSKMSRLASVNTKESVEVSPSDFIKNNVKWANYPLGVADQLRKLGHKMEGADLLFSGDVPAGAGLSSSASIEMVTAVALNDLFSFGLEMMDLVKLSQKAENEFVGVNCGIMDQFASGMGKKDHAMLLNCLNLDYELVPLVLGDYTLIISNTNKKRGLTDSKYNERRSECEQSVEFLSRASGIKFLGEMDFPAFLDAQRLIPDEIVRRRAQHVISENKRVLDAVRALRGSDLKKFGELMTASHASLRDDYEVTGIELDTLVEEALSMKGVIGSRMTGAGFGGCTVSLVHKDAAGDFISSVGKSYERRIGLHPEFYRAEVGPGARRLA